MFTLKPLTQSGFDHLFGAVFCIVAIGLVGSFMIVLSHAYTVQWKGTLEEGSTNSGYCLSTTGGTNGSKAVLNPCANGTSAVQTWSLNYTALATLLGSKNVQEFTLQSSDGKTECLNDPDGSKSNGVALQIYTCSSNDKNNLWVWGSSLTSKKLGNHQLVNVATISGSSALCLDDSYSSHAVGAKVQLYACNTSGPTNQSWYEYPAGSGSSSGSTSVTLTHLPVQPATLMYYGDTTRGSVYEHPGAMVVTGRGNYQDQTFKDISAAGGSVLIYLDPIINDTEGRYESMLINASACGAAVPKWPGGPEANSTGYLNDFRVGGIEQEKLQCVLNTMVSENPQMAGWFVDDLGSRSWYPDFDWDTWGTTNQQAYRSGAIAISQTFREVANEHHLIFIVNGTWGAGTLAADGGGYPNMNLPGNALADGGFVEHHDASELSYWSGYACSKQWATQSPVTNGVAFNWAVTTSESDRVAYANSNCFAYVNDQPTANYDYAAPWGSFHTTGLPTKVTP